MFIFNSRHLLEIFITKKTEMFTFAGRLTRNNVHIQLSYFGEKKVPRISKPSGPLPPNITAIHATYTSNTG